MIKIVEKPELPKEFTKAKASPVLLAQTVRAFLANKRQGTQSALTRAEVDRTRKKVFKQKGTGHARHGDRKAPIFVGGGVAFAPKPRDYSLNLTQKMKMVAKNGAMTLKFKAKSMIVVSGLESVGGKTAAMAKFLSQEVKEENRVLVITDGFKDMVVRAARNIEGVEVTPWNAVNAFQILKAGRIVVMEEVFTNKTSNPNE
jgi:large subunit ribosomal protein L4